MFDYHMHSMVSFDSECAPEDMIKAAKKAEQSAQKSAEKNKETDATAGG